MAILDSQIRNRDRPSRADVENAKRNIATHCQAFYAGTRYRDALVYEQFASGQANGASDCEVDRVTVICIGERLAERAGAAVIGVSDCDRVGAQSDDRSEEQHRDYRGFDMVSYYNFHLLSLIDRIH